MSWQPRYTVLSVLFGAYMLCYLDRMVIATAIPFIAQDFNLSPLTMGGVLSAFFLGYACMQIPGGLLTDRFGPRALLVVSIVSFSVMTALTGLVAGLATLMFVRVAFGICEGPFPSAAAKAIANWFPPRELGRANGLQYGATSLGAMVAPLLVVALLQQFGWRSVFYALIVPGLIIAALVWRHVPDSPSQGAAPAATRALFMEVLRNRAVRWCAVSFFLTNLVSWGLMNWLPTYLLHARGFAPEKMGLFAGVSNLIGALGYPLGGIVCDRFFSARFHIPIAAGLLLSAMLTWLAVLVPSGECAAVCLGAVFMISNAACTAILTLPLVAVEKHAVGGAFGVVNTAGQLAGAFSPVLIGWVLEVTSGDFEVVLNGFIVLLLVAIYPASRIRQARALETSC